MAPDTMKRKQACEACKVRKVKCNGELRCQQCNHLDLRCVYVQRQVKSKRANRGSRLQPWQVSAQHNAQSLAPTDASHEVSISPSSQHSLEPEIHPPQDDLAWFRGVLPGYEESVYPFHPIISPLEAREAVEETAHNPEARALLCTFVAATIILTRYSIPPGEDTFLHANRWVTEAIRLLTPIFTKDDVTIRRIVIMDMVHTCLMGLGKYDEAFFYLRQSITMVQMLHIGHEQTLMTRPLPEQARYQRLYWLVFVHERYMALSYQHQMILLPLAQLPIADDTIPSNIDHWFRLILGLFTHIDLDFFSKWADTSTTRHSVTASWIRAKHDAIETEDIGAYNDPILSTAQVADLTITKYWLHTLIWQIAVSQCLLSSTAKEHSMSLLFPIRVSKQLRRIIASLPADTLVIHGSGMQEKLFDITSTIADVITTVPARSAEETKDRIEEFQFLLSFLSSLPHSTPAQRSVLEQKWKTLWNDQSLIVHQGMPDDGTNQDS